MLAFVLALVASASASPDPDYLVGAWEGTMDLPAWVFASTEDTVQPSVKFRFEIEDADGPGKTLHVTAQGDRMRKVDQWLFIGVALDALNSAQRPKYGPIPIYGSDYEWAKGGGYGQSIFGFDRVEGDAVIYDLYRDAEPQQEVLIERLELRFRPIDGNNVAMHAFLPEHDDRLVFSFYLLRVE